jgi:hypothetical protein
MLQIFPTNFECPLSPKDNVPQCLAGHGSLWYSDSVP